MENRFAARIRQIILVGSGALYCLAQVPVSLGAEPQWCQNVMPGDSCFADVCCDAQTSHCVVSGHNDWPLGDFSPTYTEKFVCSESDRYSSPSTEWMEFITHKALEGWVRADGLAEMDVVIPPWDIAGNLPTAASDLVDFWPVGHMDISHLTEGQTSVTSELHAIRWEQMQTVKLLTLIAGLLSAKSATDNVHP